MDRSPLMYQIRADWTGAVWELRSTGVADGVIAEADDPAEAGEIAAAAIADRLAVPRSSFSVFLTTTPEQVEAWAWASVVGDAVQPSATMRRAEKLAITRSLAIDAAIVAGSMP